jgi:hypothetical protein
MNSQYCDRKTETLSTGSISPPTGVGGLDVGLATPPLSAGPDLMVKACRLILRVENGNLNTGTPNTCQASIY